MTLLDRFALAYLHMAAGQIHIKDIELPDDIAVLARDAYLFAEVMVRFRNEEGMREMPHFERGCFKAMNFPEESGEE